MLVFIFSLFFLFVSIYAEDDVSLKLPESIIADFKNDEYYDYDEFGVEEVRYTDLNGDKRNEVFVYMGGGSASGNTSIILYAKARGRWKKISNFSGAGIKIDRRKTRGWAGIFEIEHYNATYAGVRHYVWDGKKYVKDDEFSFPWRIAEDDADNSTELDRLTLDSGESFKHIKNVFEYKDGELRKISLKELKEGESAFEAYFVSNSLKNEKRQKEKFGKTFFKNSKLFALSAEHPNFCFWSKDGMIYIGDSLKEMEIRGTTKNGKTKIRLFGEVFRTEHLRGEENWFFKIKNDKVSEIIFFKE